MSFNAPVRPFREAQAADLVLLGNGWWLADVDGLCSTVTVRSGDATMTEVGIVPAKRG